MNYLNEQQVKRLIKEEIFKQVAGQVIEEQLRGKLAQWIASKIPGTSASKMDAALDTVAKEEQFEELNIDDFIAAVREELSSEIEASIGEYMNRVIDKAIRQAGSTLGKG